MNLFSNSNTNFSELLIILVDVKYFPADEQYDEYVDFTIEKIDPSCNCNQENPGGVLCDACWLEEECSNIGIKEFLFGEDFKIDKDCKIILKGKIKSDTRYDAWNGDWEGDVLFEEQFMEIIYE